MIAQVNCQYNMGNYRRKYKYNRMLMRLLIKRKEEERKISENWVKSECHDTASDVASVI